MTLPPKADAPTEIPIEWLLDSSNLAPNQLDPPLWVVEGRVGLLVAHRRCGHGGRFFAARGLG